MVDSSPPRPEQESSQQESGRPGSSTGGEDPENPAAGSPGEREPAPRILAKLYEDEQKGEAPGRWAVGVTRRSCHQCGQELTPGSSFHSTLSAAPIPADDTRLADVSELFERHDYCQACFAEIPREEAFAHWKSLVDAPTHAPRKTVNLSALLAYFVHLGEARRDPEDPGPPLDAPQMSEQASARVRYLLALFLVRKRVLRWISLVGPVLIVEEVREDLRHHVDVPALEPQSMEEALQAFEELFS